MDKNSLELISSLNFWENKIEITPIKGGITNQNFLVKDNLNKYFVRIGDDIPCLLYTSPSPRDRG